MTTTALVHQPETPAFALGDYLDNITDQRFIDQQKKLAAAYDNVCQALIGPNDIQQDGGRSFKKKSAWRKLARHFRISVAAGLESVRVDYRDDGEFTAIAIATACAPWGQSWTEVGACGSDEAVGRRVITVADAVATAMTRAANRAVSNLIAMGEVSADEIGERREPAQRSVPKSDADKRMPFGKNKGKPLGEIASEDLESAIVWCREKGKFADLITAMETVLNGRPVKTTEDGEVTGYNDERVDALRDDPDELPF